MMGVRLFGLVLGHMLRREAAAVGYGGVVVFMAVMLASFFAIALAPAARLDAAAPAVLVLVLTVAGLLQLEAIWHRPLARGYAEALLLAGVPALAIVAAFVVAHWLLTAVPLLLAAAPLALMLQWPLPAVPGLIFVLLPLTFYVSLVGGLGAVLTFGARQAGILALLIVLPLLLPMVLLGLMALAAAGLEPGFATPYVMMQAALLLAALPVALAASAFTLRALFFR